MIHFHYLRSSINSYGATWHMHCHCYTALVHMHTSIYYTSQVATRSEIDFHCTLRCTLALGLCDSLPLHSSIIHCVHRRNSICMPLMHGKENVLKPRDLSDSVYNSCRADCASNCIIGSSPPLHEVLQIRHLICYPQKCPVSWAIFLCPADDGGWRSSYTILIR